RALMVVQSALACLEAATVLPQVRAGKIRAYAVMAKQRCFGAPDIPTADEAGARGVNMPFWHGMWAPKGTPKEIVARLNAAVVEAFADPAVRGQFAKIGHEIPAREDLPPKALLR